MSDPKPWLDDPPFAGSLAERLITAGKKLELPPGSVERGWGEFSSALAAGAAAGTALPAAAEAASGALTAGASAGLGATTTAATSLLSSSSLIKAFLLGAVLGAGTAGGAAAVHWAASREHASAAEVGANSTPARAAAERFAPVESRNPPSPPAPAETAAEVSGAAPSPNTPAARAASRSDRQSVSIPPGTARVAAEASSSSPSTDAAPSATSAARSPNERTANSLTVEAAELARASNLLGTGDPRAALELLERSAASFERGALVQEREALIVDALMQKGDRARGLERARAFLRRFPNSPMAERMRRWESGK